MVGESNIVYFFLSIRNTLFHRWEKNIQMAWKKACMLRWASQVNSRKKCFFPIDNLFQGFIAIAVIIVIFDCIITQVSHYQATIQSPVSSLLRKVESEKTGNVMGISKHGRKVSCSKFTPNSHIWNAYKLFDVLLEIINELFIWCFIWQLGSLSVTLLTYSFYCR